MTSIPKPEAKVSLSSLHAKARAGDKKAAAEYFKLRNERKKKRKSMARPTASSSVTLGLKYALAQSKKVCETLWPIFIKNVFDYQCVLKGKDSIHCSGKKKSDMQAAHLITRGVPNIKFDKDNGVCLCSGHHVYYTHNPGEWERICRLYWPEIYERLWQRKWSHTKPDWTLWEKELKDSLELLKHG